MIAYYLRLACKSFARSPGLTALTAGAIALGISVSVVTVSVYHLLSGNPIWWKNDRLFAVTMDNYPASLPPGLTVPNLDIGPSMLTYRDARYLFASNIPQRKAILYLARGALTGGTLERRPLRVTTRVTTGDFFSMFDVPFLYGGGWTGAAERDGEPVIVLSRPVNDKLFGGANSVGRTVRWNDRAVKVVGVLDHWSPLPRFYDPGFGSIEPPEDSYVPWGPGLKPPAPSAGNMTCLDATPLQTIDQFLRASECDWVPVWVELPDRESRSRMQTFLDNYWSEQRKAGRFPRRRSNRLTNVDQWLSEHQILADENHVLVAIGFAFFIVCVINVVGLLLAKFLSRAPVTGIRRALGASRQQIFLQHIVEAGALAAAGATLGLALAEFLLWRVYSWIDLLRFADSSAAPATAMRFDAVSLLWALVLAIGATLGAGLYPAWRAGRVPPAVHLKSQ